MTPQTTTRIVQKYGGTSVATPAKLRRVARRVRETLRSGVEVVVVVSAMGDTTDELIALAHRVTNDPPSREMDQLLSTGETITAPLLAMALEAAGAPAVSLTGVQAGIRTSRAHRTARIVDVVPQRVLDELSAGRVVVVAGFQGVTDDMEVTTLGRGGSDTSAVALAVAIGAARCEIFTDVAGVFTADPRLVTEACVIPEIAYDEMLEFAAAGAGVMHPRAVEIAEAYSMDLRVLSTFSDEPGTVICRHPSMEERQKVRGIAHETDVAKVTLLRVPDRPGVAASIFEPFGTQGISVDIVVQNVAHDATTDVSFIIAESDLARARRMLAGVARDVGAKGYMATAGIAKVSVIGTGLRGTPAIFAKVFRTLADAGINIQMISTGEIHLTCIIDRVRLRDAVRALHAAFELEKI
jgi:aspartate kinase